MSSLDKNQDYLDYTLPWEFDKNYSIHLDESIRDPNEAFENIRKVLFEENQYVDEGVMWESLKCISKNCDIKEELDGECPYKRVSVTPNYEVRDKMKSKDQEKLELIQRLDRGMVAIKAALYGNEEIDVHAVNAAIKSLDFMVYGYNIEEKKLNVTRKG